ncbi:hypothetical protein KEM56_004105, partial [Ascosphaera pollenicola]
MTLLPKTKTRVAFLGPFASFSHQAAVAAFGPAPTCDLQPKPSFADIFADLQAARIDYAVIPFENSTNGSVVQILDLFADRQAKYNDIVVCSEYYLTVHQCLLMRKAEGANSIEERYSAVQKLYTHPQAWGQCEKYLAKHFKRVERQDTSSTSKAAHIVAALPETQCDSAAAIASKFAADTNADLDMVAENIEDVSGNTTRFLVLRNIKASTTSNPVAGNTPSPPAKRKSLISFEIDHNRAGALASALMLFKDYGLNLTSINSRPGL